MRTGAYELLLAELAQRARTFAASGAAPAQPRLAATVVLIQAGSAAGGGFEVFLLRRAASMTLAPGRYVFPGGAVDPADYPADRRVDRRAGDWPARLGLPAPDADAVVHAAVREVAEETGVWLAAADLAPWARWVTPEFEPRRYDTYFFVARLPAGQQPTAGSPEADRAQWCGPGEAVARFETGELAMLPPTVVTLAELADYGSVAEVLAAAPARDAATPVSLSLPI